MGTLLSRRRYMGGGGGYPADAIMTIETNPEVLAVCYAQGWCASPDYMTYAEAAAVTSIGNAFNTFDITHFNEFEYFTSITTLSGNEFRWATALKEITLPSTLISISSGCYAFENVILDKFVCKSQYLTSLGGVYTYRYATIQQAIIDCLSAEMQSNGMFPVKHLVLENNVKNFRARMHNINMLEVAEGVENIGEFANAAQITDIVLPSTVSNIYGEGIRNCTSLTSLTVKNPIPFTVSNYMFFGTNANLQIYVPAASVDVYKAANVWKTKASVIQAIPE